MKELMGTLSPAYGMVTGEGLFGNAVGILPAIAKDIRDDKDKDKKDAAKAAGSQNMKKGGKVESKLMGKEGRGMAKATMQKVASKAVKGHESRMHKAKSIDGIALRGKTRGRMM